MTLLPDLLRSLIPQRHTQKMTDPDPMTCDPGSLVYDLDPGTVIPDPIYLVTTLHTVINHNKSDFSKISVCITLTKRG